MNQERLNYLFEQHRLKRLSPQEEAELDAWYEELDDPSFVPIYEEGSPEATAYVAGHTKQIMARIARRKRGRLRSLWMKIAAILIVGLIVGYLVWPEGQGKRDEETAAVTEPASYNRYLTLPDSSTVILGEGSSLQLAEGFSKANRVLTLTGEAYFDVKHNANLPFVIQTGKVKTTVLGTAFNIKQIGDSVAVTVARGKVQVARDNKVLAVLEPGQQIATSNRSAIAELKAAELEAVTAWMHEDLHFSNTILGDVVAQLRQRYGADIVLKTPGIEHCTISVETPFSGTESLNTILDVICATLGATYTNNNGQIEITGEPCKR